MTIVLASSEAVPFSKTGGLADVTSALSAALDQSGRDVWLFVPHYPQARQASDGVAAQVRSRAKNRRAGPSRASNNPV